MDESTPVATIEPLPEAIQKAIAENDLSRLSPEHRLMYYRRKCQSLGLNPLTQPFMYVMLNNKLQLYAKKDCTDQLRKLHGVSLWVDEPKFERDLIIVHVRARDASGREDEDFGFAPSNAKGEALGNAILKATTKGKRRVTLSICGLGVLDEMEIESIPGAKIGEPVSGEQEPELTDSDTPQERHPTLDEMQVLQQRAVSADIDESTFWMQIRRMLDIPASEKISKKGIRDRMTMSQYEAADAEYRDQIRKLMEPTFDDDVPDYQGAQDMPQETPQDATEAEPIPEAAVTDERAAEPPPVATLKPVS
jgi:hypothetical protein